MQKLVILVALAVCFGAAHAQQLVDYTSSAVGFSLKYPDTFKEMDPHGEALVLSTVAEEWTSKNTVDLQLHHGEKGLIAVCQNFEKEWATSPVFKDFKILSQKDTTFKSYVARVYHCTAEVPQINKMVEWRSTFFIKGDTVYKMTLSSYPGRFEAADTATRVIYESFHFN